MRGQISRLLIVLVVSPLIMGQFWLSEQGKIENALQAYLSKRGYCFFISGFPRVPLWESAEFKALESAGLIAKIDNEQYDLTALGKQYYVHRVEPNMMTNRWLGGFCVGTRKLTKIEVYTTPTAAPFGKMTQATYIYSVADLPDWIKNAALIKQFEMVSAIANGTNIRDKAMLVETNRGWIHESEMMR